MKAMLIFAAMSFSVSALAIDMGAVKQQGAKLAEQGKAKAQELMEACKEDKIKFCEKYTELEALKKCLNENKEKLTPSCKAAAGIK